MTVSKPSQRAAQRLARQIAEERATPPALPDDLETMLVGYRVAGVSNDTWATARPALLDAMRHCHIRGEASFRKHLGVVAQYLVHRVELGRSLEVDIAFSATHIDHYYLHGLSDKSERTRNDYRSRLTKIAEHIAGGAGAPVKSPSLGHRSVRPGYTGEEEARIRRVALRQRNPRLRRQMCAIVGLTMGAGLGAADLRPLFVSEIQDHGDDVGIEVAVTGPSPRTVWVRREYEQFVRIGIEGLAAGQLVIGQQVDRRNVTTGVLEDVDRFDAPVLDASRMRSTWLSWLLFQRVPVQLILQASGLKTARTVTELVEHLDDVDDDDASAAMLRGAQR